MADVKFSYNKKLGGKEFRIKRISPMIYEDINNIADNLGISVTSFLKTELLHIISRHPETYRKKRNEDG